MEHYLDSVTLRSRSRASKLESSTSIAKGLEMELRGRNVDSAMLEGRHAYLAFELPASVLPRLAPSFASKLHRHVSDMILHEQSRGISDYAKRAKIKATLQRQLPRKAHWISSPPEEGEGGDKVEDGALTLTLGSRSRRGTKRGRDSSSSTGLLDHIRTLVIGQVMGALPPLPAGGERSYAVLQSAVARLESQLGIQVNISNGKNSPAHVAGNAVFGKLRESLKGDGQMNDDAFGEAVRRAMASAPVDDPAALEALYREVALLPDRALLTQLESLTRTVSGLAEHVARMDRSLTSLREEQRKPQEERARARQTELNSDLALPTTDQRNLQEEGVRAHQPRSPSVEVDGEPPTMTPRVGGV